MGSLSRKIERRPSGRSAGALSDGKVQEHVRRMTSWQRSQWARDGYDPEQAERYAALRRPSR